MKLAFCLFKYFPYGGLQRGFIDLAMECVSRGHVVDVYTGSWNGKLPKELSLTIVPMRRLTNHSRYLAFANRVHKIAANKHYDAIVGFNKMPGLDIYFASDVCYAALAKKRSLFYRISPRCKTLCYLERSVFDPHLTTQIISISDKEIDNYIAHYGTSRRRFHPVPPGIPPERIESANMPGARESLRSEMEISDTTNVVLMVGSDYKRKGVDRAIKAISALPDKLRRKTLLLVIGEGKKKPYQRMAQQLQVSSHVHFLGKRDDVPRFLACADILLHPAYHETAGAVLIEALGAGLPVLVTDVCGYATHVERAEGGRIVPSPFQQEVLNQMLYEMIVSEDKRTVWSQNGQMYVQHADVHGRHRQAANIIEKVAGSK